MKTLRRHFIIGLFSLAATFLFSPLQRLFNVRSHKAPSIKPAEEYFKRPPDILSKQFQAGDLYQKQDLAG